MTPTSVSSLRSKDRDLVCMVVPYFDRIGGYELQAQSLCQAYHRFGKQSFILTTPTPGLPQFERREYFDIYRIPKSIQRPSTLSLYLLYLFFCLKKIPTVLHCHSISPLTEQILRLNRYLKIPALLKIATEGDIEHLQHTIQSDKKNGSFRRKNYEHVNFIHLNANIKLELLNFDINAKKIFSIPNGVDTTRFSPVSENDKKKIKTELGFSENRHLITFIGRLEERKRVIDLIDAWSKIEKHYPDHDLLIVGDGEEKESCQKLCYRLNIQNRVIFQRATNSVESFLRISSLFVLPSRLEGLPNIMLEAMATAVPILASDISGINEAIEHQKTGFLTPMQNVAALVESLHYVLQSPHLSKQWGHAARQKVLRNYCFNTIVPQFFELYTKLKSHNNNSCPPPLINKNR